MKFCRLLFLTVGLKLTLVAGAAHGSYVVEAESVGIISGAIATDFDFVAHDFGMEPKDAIQITLDKLSSAINLQGNLLLRSFPFASGEDYSRYDIESADADHGFAGPKVNVVNGEDHNAFAGTGALLPAGGQSFPSIDTNAIFRMLGPTSFRSFSQLTAARFGFYHSQ